MKKLLTNWKFWLALVGAICTFIAGGMSWSELANVLSNLFTF